ncbi:biotin synthase BioB [Fluviispira multicolorata]|uniref:Biotin synthase n=1 Tax=Fluviispira multicolorata TaxID=2654512 RepID=A0A833JD25_9BACT|nr:biotin synthase BioB [Fluviispira multicolorata]KAB8028078.1 biotin synthase BioB [Fluviispira multicolorata]
MEHLEFENVNNLNNIPCEAEAKELISENYDEHLYLKAVELYEMPFLQLMQEAALVHKEYWPEADIQRSALLSIKTGSCPEDCSYCPQSARYETDIKKHPLMEVCDIVEKAKVAKENGAQRFCMGAAWRKPPRGEQFDRVLEAIREVKALGMEACVTLGLLNDEQSRKLKEAGLDYYNHNVDTSKDYYSKIITTRKFKDRVETLRNLRRNDINICCGGILGMGESAEDRMKLVAFLATMDPQPESIPINFLVKFDGTPLENQEDVDVLEFVRTIAVARIMIPKARLRLSAGRMSLSREAQILCLAAGANSIFSGDILLTSPLPGYSFDNKLIDDVTKPLKIVKESEHVN